MWLRDIILAHQMKLSDAVERGDNDAQFSCLMFALQLPSICARLEFPRDKYEQFYSGGTPRDRELYIKWLEKNHALLVAVSSGFLTFNEFCSAVYELRCSLVHEGILTTNKKLQNIRFLSGKSSGISLGISSIFRSITCVTRYILVRLTRLVLRNFRLIRAVVFRLVITVR